MNKRPKATAVRVDPPPGLDGPSLHVERITTTVRIDMDQWRWLRQYAQERSVAQGGRPDVSAALRDVLYEKMTEDFAGARVEVETPHGLRKMHPKRADAHMAESLGGIEDAREMGPDELRRLRAAMRLTQGALGRRLGRDKMTVSRWERGKVHIRAAVALKVRQLARELLSSKGTK